MHLWACDTNNEIHVLCHVTSTENFEMKWREVDGELSQVSSGSNIICGITSDKQLHVRTNVSYQDPLGKKWAETGFDDIKQLAVGGAYLAVWLPKGGVLIGSTNLIRNRDFCPIKWGEIADATPTDLVQITMCCDDILYGITKGGAVYGCYGIREEMKPLQWELIAKPPAIAKSGFLKSLFKRSNALFHDISCNSKGVWCYSKDNQEVWHLIISGKNKTSWTKYKLPNSTCQLISIKCHPLYPIIYGLSIDSTTIYQINVTGPLLLSVNELPFHGCGDIVIATISCSIVYKSNDEEEEEGVRSLYPKLPKDICCETGTCGFCLTRNTLNSTKTFDEPRTKYPVPIEESRGSVAGRKRQREDTDYELVYLSPCHQATPPYKRRRHYSKRFTQQLIKDIPITVAHPTNVLEVSNVS